MRIGSRICALLALLLALTGCAATVNVDFQTAANTVSATDTVAVHYIDVGQGDAALIVGEAGAVLIDAGESSAGGDVVSYLQKLGITELDVVVATHPHSDHIGGLPEVLENVTVKSVIMPDAVHTTKTFERLLDAIEAGGIPLNQGKAGDAFGLGSIAFQIVAPNSGDYEDLNNYSVCVRMTYGDTSFLFTGDAEKLSEEEMLTGGQDLSANVLKVGHHGSRTSTTPAFLNKVGSSMAVISCAKDNSYGHPHKETLKTLENAGVDVYRTDEMGTIIMETDGASVVVKTGG